jgi:hypothetical protein
VDAAAEFPHIERERVRWHPTGVGEPFELGLDELFRPI